jgi:BNR repeat-like domain
MFIVLAVWLSHRSNAAETAGPQTVNTNDDIRYKFVRLRDGTLVGLFDGRTVHPDGPPSETVKAKYSKDNGVTWSKAAPLLPIPSDPGTWSIAEAVVDHDDELHAFFMIVGSGLQVTGGEGERPLVGELLGSRIDIGYIRSTNLRTQWSKPRVLWIGYTGALNSAIQMRSGRILLPFSYLTARNWGNRGEGLAAFTFVGQYNCTVIYSDDGGNNWHLGTDLMVPVPDIVSAYGAVEPVVVQLEDGRVWNLIRTQMGRFWESYSTDGAKWSEPRPTSIISSDSPAGLVRLSDGRIVLLWNNCLRYPYAYGGRQVLHAAISEDSGRSWRGFREVGRDPFRNEAPPSGHDYGTAYPFPTLANDDKVIFVSGQGEGRVLRKMLDPAWLYGTKQTADFAQRAEEWSTFGTRGVEIVPHSTEPHRKVLQIRKTDEHWPAAAVWNFPAGSEGRVRLKILPKTGFQGALIALTDHFSTPYDLEDHFNSMHNLWIGVDGRLPNGGALKPNEWNTLELAWDAKQQTCRVVLDGEPQGSLPVVRSSPNVCYLRLRSTAERTDENGFLVESVEADVQPEAKLEAP